MATKKKQKRNRQTDPSCQLVIRERLKALDDAANAAVESIADHVGLDGTVSTVTTGLFMSGACVVWHATAMSEEEFVETARRCYQKIAEAHAHCERGGDGEASVPHQRRDRRCLVTLAEIRELLLRELTACALAGDETDDFARGGPRSAVLRRVGRPLVLRHVRPGQCIRWYEKLYSDEPLVVERVEAAQVMFGSPRLVIDMPHFLNAIVKGQAVDG